MAVHQSCSYCAASDQSVGQWDTPSGRAQAELASVELNCAPIRS